jgi:hypothetical protein
MTRARDVANIDGILTTKGDIYAATAAATPARLAVGNNGETLVADSSTSTGLRYGANFAAGKNKVINGDFNVNQRSFTSTTTDATYGFDRWLGVFSDGTVTYSAETFTLGAAPVTGYESTNYARLVTTGQTLTSAATFLSQKIENVKTFAGQTVTVSFWAQAGSGTPSISIELDQQFGTSGSTRVTTFAGKNTISTSWARYTATVLVPSISGKTIGAINNSLNLNMWVSAGSAFDARTGTLGIQSNTFNIWGVQIEEGSVATAFQTATGTLQGELSAAQRYYWRFGGDDFYETFGNGQATSTTSAAILVKNPVTMRIAPTSIDFSTLSIQDGAGLLATVTSLVFNQSSKNSPLLTASVASGLTQFRPYILGANNSKSGYIGFNAEL